MSIKKFFKKYQDQWIISLILLAIYLVESAVRPLIAPYEYQFISDLQKIFPDYPDKDILWRLPAVLITFAGAGIVWLSAKLWKFKHPGQAAVFYLLFPPVFYIGTSATLLPLVSTGVLAALYGLMKSAQTASIKKRFLTILSMLPVIIAALLYIDSALCKTSDLWMLAVTAAALIIMQFFNRLEQDKERTERFLNRFSRIMSVILLLLAIVVLVPSLLRHFKVDFPPEFSFYRAGERVIRPMLMLLMPLVWLHLARESKKNGKKLLLIGGSFAFLLFALPITLPWHIQNKLYWHYSFERISRELPPEPMVCFVEKRDIPFVKRFIKCRIIPIGSASGESTPENLAKAVSGKLGNSNVLIVCSSDKVEKSCPIFTGKRYTTGNFRMFYYFKNGVEKK